MFDNAVVLLPMNKEVDERNIHMMERVSTPVAKIEAPWHLKGGRGESGFGLLQ
jgi:hypothetical protein